MACQGSRHGQGRLGAQTGATLDAGELLCFGAEGAGFVEHQGVHPRQGFQSLQAAHQYAARGQAPGGSQHSSRCGQRQSAGAGHHEHRHRQHHGVGRITRPPPQGDQRSGQQHADQKRFGQAIGQARQLGLLGSGALHQRHDAGKTRVTTGFVDPHAQGAGQVVAARQHRIAGAAGQRARLAGEHGFIHRALALQHHTVSRKGLTGVDTQHIAHAHAARSNPLCAAVCAQALHAVGQTVEHRIQRTSGALAQAQFQPTAAEQKKHKHGERVEIHLAPERTVRFKRTGTADGKSRGNA